MSGSLPSFNDANGSIEHGGVKIETDFLHLATLRFAQYFSRAPESRDRAWQDKSPRPVLPSSGWLQGAFWPARPAPLPRGRGGMHMPDDVNARRARAIDAIARGRICPRD